MKYFQAGVPYEVNHANAVHSTVQCTATTRLLKYDLTNHKLAIVCSKLPFPALALPCRMVIVVGQIAGYLQSMSSHIVNIGMLGSVPVLRTPYSKRLLSRCENARE